jgi:hypothetical protein
MLSNHLSVGILKLGSVIHSAADNTYVPQTTDTGSAMSSAPRVVISP